MKVIGKALFIFLSITILLLTGCQAVQPSRSADEIIKNLILSYACYQENAENEIQALLKELKTVDSQSQAKWEQILTEWHYVNSGLQVHTAEIPENLENSDSLGIVVLGYSLNSDGSMREELIGRLQTALLAAEKYDQAYVICTGGGTASNAPELTEADVMAKWLTEHGIDQNRIIIENKSLSTAQNAENVIQILKDHYPTVCSLVMVSSDYHIAWGQLMFDAAAILSANAKIQVISNAAYEAGNNSYDENMLYWQAGGLCELIGDSQLASQFYHDEITPPEL